MAKILDRGLESDIKNDILSFIEERGYKAEEAIPGLISAVIESAFSTTDPGQAVDEATDLLVDGDIVEEAEDEEEEEVDLYGKV